MSRLLNNRLLILLLTPTAVLAMLSLVLLHCKNQNQPIASQRTMLLTPVQRASQLPSLTVSTTPTPMTLPRPRFSITYPGRASRIVESDEYAIVLPGYNIDIDSFTRRDWDVFMKSPFPDTLEELQPIAQLPPLSHRRRITIDGNEALRGEAVGGGDPAVDMEVAVFIRGSFLYQAFLDRKAAQREMTLDRDRAVFNQILSSWEFLDE